MMPKIAKDIVAGTLLIIILGICYYGFMPDGILMVVHSILVILFGIVAILIWHDKSIDEREQNHKLISAQAAFTAGGLVLVSTIVYGGLTTYHVTPSIYFAFGAMILGKIMGQLWAHKFR